MAVMTIYKRDFFLNTRNMGVEPKIGVFTTPNHPMFNRVFHYKPSILGAQHPYVMEFYQHKSYILISMAYQQFVFVRKMCTFYLYNISCMHI